MTEMNPDVNMGSHGNVFLEKVKQFADSVLQYGIDRYGECVTPLFVDGLNIYTHEPVTWSVEDQEWVLSNYANQQVLFRTFYALTQITGDVRYAQAAEKATEYVLNHLRNGKLIAMGGHMAYDLKAKNKVFAPDKGPVHELKCHYPFYELMWSVDTQQSMQYIDAIWEGHILHWDTLEFSRHGVPATHSLDHEIWNQTYSGSDIPFVGRGLTFINAGSDLIYAAGMLYSLSGDKEPLRWARRLAYRYMETRHPQTGLGGYQFSISILPGQNGRGDRAVHQFGEQLKNHQPNETNVMVSRQILTMLGNVAISRMILSERLGVEGNYFLDWAVEDLLAYAKHSYDVDNNIFHPIVTNGFRLTGLKLEQSGYYGKKGEYLKPLKAGFLLLWSYVMAYRLSNHPDLWSTARSIAKGIGLGDIGQIGEIPKLEFAHLSSDPLAIFSTLELYKVTGNSVYLSYASKIGEELLSHRFKNDFFVSDEHQIYAKFDAVEPLALLHLVAQLRGMSEVIPNYVASNAFFGSQYGKLGHKKDNDLFYHTLEF